MLSDTYVKVYHSEATRFEQFLRAEGLEKARKLFLEEEQYCQHSMLSDVKDIDVGF